MALENAQLTIGRRQSDKGRLAFVGAMLGTHNTDVHYALAFIFSARSRTSSIVPA